jgi:hypothetical protein
MVIGKLKYLIELVRGTYLPTVLTLFPWGLMVGAEQGFILEGGGPVPWKENKWEKVAHVTLGVTMWCVFRFALKG